MSDSSLPSNPERKADVTGSNAIVHMLWAVSPRFTRPQLVSAWSDGYVDCWQEAFARDREEAEQWFRDFGDECDGPWSFWMTVEHVPLPQVPEPEEIARGC